MSERRVTTAVNMAVRQRNYRRVRDRALARLANAYPEDYKKLLEQEKANDETQGRKWLDINGTTGSMDTRSNATFNTGAEADHSGTYQGDNGGEA